MAGSTIFFLVLVGAVGACRLVELRLAALTGEETYERHGRSVLELVGVFAPRHPSRRSPHGARGARACANPTAA